MTLTREEGDPVHDIHDAEGQDERAQGQRSDSKQEGFLILLVPPAAEVLRGLAQGRLGVADQVLRAALEVVQSLRVTLDSIRTLNVIFCNLLQPAQLQNMSASRRQTRLILRTLPR